MVGVGWWAAQLRRRRGTGSDRWRRNESRGGTTLKGVGDLDRGMRRPSSADRCDSARSVAPDIPARGLRSSAQRIFGALLPETTSITIRRTRSTMPVANPSGGSLVASRPARSVSRHREGAGRPRPGCDARPSIRPLAVATTTGCGQLKRSASVPISIVCSASILSASGTGKSGRPSIASATPTASPIVRDSLVVAAAVSRNDYRVSAPAQPLLATHRFRRGLGEPLKSISTAKRGLTDSSRKS